MALLEALPPLESRKNSIFVLSKNRPQTLALTLASLQHVEAQLVVVDDSTSRQVQTAVKNIVDRAGGHYHASANQRRMMQDLRIPASSEFIRPLGNRRWDTGHVRNYVLLLASALKCKKATFVDDDIVLRDSSLYERLNEGLADCDFIGARATGLIDDSVLGHLQRAMGESVDEYVSAGFLAFKPRSVRYPFLNVYNEDWIWLYLHSREAKISRVGTVYHVPTFKKEGLVKEATFQELGEFLVTGVELAVRDNEFETTLADRAFWNRISELRTREIEEMILESDRSHFRSAIRAAKVVLRRQKTFKPARVASMFRNFFADVGDWQRIMESARISDVTVV